MKKIISLCLALCVLFALAIPAGAAGTGPHTWACENDGARLNNDVALLDYDGEDLTGTETTTTSGTVRANGAAADSVTPVEEPTRTTNVCEKDGAYLNNDIELMEYDGEDITDTLPAMTTSEISQGPVLYANDSDVSVIKGRAMFTEKGKGAHYYAFSTYGNSYSEAFSNIKLPSIKNGNRNGYVALGIHGSAHGVDLGLRNTGSGWHPCYYDVNGTFKSFEQYAAPSNATNAKIVVKPVSTTKVHMYIQFLNSAGANVGTAFDRDIAVNSGNFTTSGGKVMCYYYRFASLVPKSGADNRSDGTYMTGGQFTNCQLYNRSSYVSWGITSDRMANVWKVYPSKITLSYTTYNDTFNIRHS